MKDVRLSVASLQLGQLGILRIQEGRTLPDFLFTNSNTLILVEDT